MLVPVARVGGVTVAVVDVVDMVAMGDRLVAAAVAVLVRMVIVGDMRKRVLVIVVVVGMVGMAVVDVVDVAFVLRAGVATIGSVLVSVVVVNVVGVGRGHGCSLLW